jgi:hypothetical protein
VEERCELVREAGAKLSAIYSLPAQENVLDKVFKWIAPCSLPNRYSFQHVHQYTIGLGVDSKSSITL